MSKEDYSETASFYMIQIAKLHRQLISEEFANMGLFVGQDMILRLLWEEEGLTQTQIITKLKVEPPTVTKMIHRMVKSGLLKRERDLRDARVSRIFLTDQGRQLKDSITQVWNDVNDRLIGGLSEDERRALQNLLRRLLHNMS